MSTISPEKKEADTKYPVHDTIEQRWSPRSFADREVDDDLIRQCFDAARWAPSSFNEQPWRFIYAKKEDGEAYEQLTEVLNDFNEKWAADAPVLILTIYKDHFSRNNKENRAATHDLGAAMAYFTFEATRHDLYVHQMAGVLPDKARELYDIPEGFHPFTMAAVGYLGDPDDLPDDLADQEKAERSRKDINEVAFRGKWND